MARLALLIGLIIIPALLLWLGHGLRKRSPRLRGAYWGGVIGHTAALVIAVVALHFPPVLWTGHVRIAIAFWTMCVGAVAGAAIGSIRART